MATPCEVTDCDGEAFAAWSDENGDVIRACTDCSDGLRAAGWDYVSQV